MKTDYIGTSKLKILLCIIAHRDAGKSVSYRDLCLASGTSKNYVRNCLLWLSRSGLIDIEERSHRTARPARGVTFQLIK